jgi:hypothetical protein
LRSFVLVRLREKLGKLKKVGSREMVGEMARANGRKVAISPSFIHLLSFHVSGKFS